MRRITLTLPGTGELATGYLMEPSDTYTDRVASHGDSYAGIAAQDYASYRHRVLPAPLSACTHTAVSLCTYTAVSYPLHTCMAICLQARYKPPLTLDGRLPGFNLLTFDLRDSTLQYVTNRAGKESMAWRACLLAVCYPAACRLLFCRLPSCLGCYPAVCHLAWQRLRPRSATIRCRLDQWAPSAGALVAGAAHPALHNLSLPCIAQSSC